MSEFAGAETTENEMVFTDDEADAGWEPDVSDEDSESQVPPGPGGGSLEDIVDAMGHWGDGAGDGGEEPGANSDPWEHQAARSLAHGFDGAVGATGGGSDDGSIKSTLGTGANLVGVGTGLPAFAQAGSHFVEIAKQSENLSAARHAARLSGPNGMPTSSLKGANALKGAGIAASALSIGLAGHDMAENGVGLQNSSDMFAGGAGLVGAVASGPVGAVAGAFSAGYGIGQLADQTFGISDAIVDGLTEDRDTGPRDSVRLSYMNEKATRAKYRAMWAQTDEERAEAEGERAKFEAMRDERIDEMKAAAFGSWD